MMSLRKKLNVIRKPDFNVVYFRGGLGSQILALNEYFNKKSLSDQIEVNFDYYLKGIGKRNNPKLSMWNWELGVYGISIDNIKSGEINNRNLLPPPKTLAHVSLYKKVKQKLFRREPSLDEFSSHAMQYNLYQPNPKTKTFLSNYIFSNKEIDSILFNNRKILRIDKKNLTALHIRRGDYLHVSSKIITIEEICAFILNHKEVILENLVVFSDSNFSKTEKNTLYKTIKKINKFNKIYIYDSIGLSVPLIHECLRKANVLIATNSTFSYSAGLFRENLNSKVYFPSNFFSGEASTLNSLFTSQSNFSIMI